MAGQAIGQHREAQPDRALPTPTSHPRLLATLRNGFVIVLGALVALGSYYLLDKLGY